jgi:tetratricopeptide (TPR) repeat protein
MVWVSATTETPLSQKIEFKDADKAFTKAMLLLRRREFEVALSYLDDACHSEPQRMLYRAYRAYAAHLCGRCTEGAVLRLVHTYTLMESNDTPQLMLLLGHIRRRKGKLEKARYWYERAYELAPNDPEIARALERSSPQRPAAAAEGSNGLWQTMRSWLRV